mgnify:CR=1 FL=1
MSHKDFINNQSPRFTKVNCIATLAILLLLNACGSSGDDDSVPVNMLPASAETSNSGESADFVNNSSATNYKVLFLGNSHIATIPGLLSTFVKAHMPTKSMNTTDTPNILFLDEKLHDNKSVQLLENNSWTHVVLQGQKYSQSGQVEYSTTETQEWIKKTKVKKATPILFPEHPQKGDPAEGIRVLSLHLGIAALEPSCVAPIGPAWKAVIDQYPEVDLHAPDGNHASLSGQFLSALVFYQVLTGESADLLPYIDSIDVSPELQDAFGQIVSSVIEKARVCPDTDD